MNLKKAKQARALARENEPRESLKGTRTQYLRFNNGVVVVNPETPRGRYRAFKKVYTQLRRAA